MKDFLNKHWKNIVIVILVLFSLNKCTVSCNRGNKLKQTNIEIAQRDSVITDMNDTIKHLKAEIQILNEKLTGIQNVANAKDEAIRNITEAKKNINVTVNSKK
jgi:inorganic pyrophosphatase